MALGKCRDCGHPISDSANSCPECGSTRRPIKLEIRTETRECWFCQGDGVFLNVQYKKRVTRKYRRGFRRTWENDETQRLKLDRVEEWKRNNFGLCKEYWETEFVSMNKVNCKWCGGTGKAEHQITVES